MIDIPSGLPAELVPLSWLLGVWEGSGIVDYEVDGQRRSAEFGQRISFSHDGMPFLNYSSYAWLLSEDAPADESGADAVVRLATAGLGDAEQTRPLVSELGYWSLARPRGEGDPGPGMLPATQESGFVTAEQVETLRNAAGGFDISAAIVHPTGVSELYLGSVNGPRIDLATDHVMRQSGSKEYASASRMYGLVEGHLLWAWDMAALGQDLRTHASARLAKRD